MNMRQAVDLEVNPSSQQWEAGALSKSPPWDSCLTLQVLWKAPRVPPPPMWPVRRVGGWATAVVWIWPALSELLLKLVADAMTETWWNFKWEDSQEVIG